MLRVKTVRQPPSKRQVAGSSPAGVANQKKKTAVETAVFQIRLANEGCASLHAVERFVSVRLRRIGRVADGLHSRPAIFGRDDSGAVSGVEILNQAESYRERGARENNSEQRGGN